MFLVRNLQPESKKELLLKNKLSSPQQTQNAISFFKKNTPFKKEQPLKVQPNYEKNEITDKITNSVYAKEFIPSYREKSARERYMNDIYSQKTIQHPPLKEIVHVPGLFSPRQNQKTISKLQNTILNSNDIMCRDMYSNCNVKEYKKRRTKSMYIDRSFVCCGLDLDDNGQVNSRKRKISHMTSDIFFTESEENPLNKTVMVESSTKRNKKSKEVKKDNNNNISNNNHIKKETTTKTRNTIENMHTIHNRNPMNFYTKTNVPVEKKNIVYSKFSSHCDWQHTNINAKLQRSKTVEPKIRKLYNRKSFCMKGNDRDPSMFNYYAETQQNKGEDNTNENINNNNNNESNMNTTRDNFETPRKHKKLRTNFANLNSVNYNIISPERGEILPKKNFSYMKTERQNCKIKEETLKNIDYYEINCGDKVDKINMGLLKNAFYSEGIHIFKFEDSSNGINGNKDKGRFTFRVRKGVNDKEYNDKMERIGNKLKMKNMKLTRQNKDLTYVKIT